MGECKRGNTSASQRARAEGPTSESARGAPGRGRRAAGAPLTPVAMLRRRASCSHAVGAPPSKAHAPVSTCAR